MKSCVYDIYKLRYNYFRFSGRHFVFPLPVAFRVIPVRSIEIFVPENMEIAVGISFLSSLTAEIQVLPVYFVRHIEIPLPV